MDMNPKKPLTHEKLEKLINESRELIKMLDENLQKYREEECRKPLE